MNKTPSLLRSALFVPSSEQKRIDKATTIPADAIIFDLEDAVAPSEKSRARDLLVAALTSGAFANRQLIVRVNGLNSPWFEDDMIAIKKAGCCDVMLPKCESSADIQRVREVLTAPDTRIFALIETAMGVLSVKDIAAALNSSEALCFGHVDFAADMGLSTADASVGIIHHARCQVVLAAKANGLLAIDNVCTDVKDETLIKEDTLTGKHLGYTGKLCVHPHQVAIINAVYTPSDEQVARANAMLSAWDEAQSRGLGAIQFENKMVDLPVIQAQQAILERYKLAQLKDE